MSEGRRVTFEWVFRGGLLRREHLNRALHYWEELAMQSRERAPR